MAEGEAGMTRDEREKVQKLVLGIDHSTGGRRLASGQLESALTAVRALLAPQPEEEPGALTYSLCQVAELTRSARTTALKEAATLADDNGHNRTALEILALGANDRRDADG